MTKIVGELLRIPAQHVLIAATGVIGQPMPMDKVRASAAQAREGAVPAGEPERGRGHHDHGHHAKEAALRVEIGGRPVTIGGIAKGVAMLEPHLATMFCFLATDAVIAADALQISLRRAMDRSFNRVTVDGDESTSDTVAVLANGLAENAPLERSGRGLRQFRQALEAVAEKLAQMLVQDGEGASKLVQVRVRGARTRQEALIAARSVANSPLVKTAICGADPNWGRIMMALGKSTAQGRRRTGWPSRSARSASWSAGCSGRARAWTACEATMRGGEYSIGIDLGLGRGEDSRVDLGPHRGVRPAQLEVHDLRAVNDARPRASVSAALQGARRGSAAALGAPPRDGRRRTERTALWLR